MEVIERDGVAGLTHRSIAEQAGVSLASASYHFAGIDELLEITLTRATDELIELLRTEPDRSAGRLARLLADEADGKRARLVALYELYLIAARRPELRGQALAWLDVIADHFAPELTGHARDAFLATVEGAGLHALVREGDWDAARIGAILRLSWPRG